VKIRHRNRQRLDAAACYIDANFRTRWQREPNAPNSEDDCDPAKEQTPKPATETRVSCKIFHASVRS
jgi:hypothetical protein